MNARRTPHLRLLRALAAMLSLSIAAARAAGMTAIAITNTLPAEKLAHAHHIVRTYEEIERLLAV